MVKPLRPGQRAPASGQYEIVNRRGTPTGAERTVVRDEPMPPTPRQGWGFVLVDRTQTKPRG